MSGLRLRRWRLIWICVFLIGPALAAAQVPAPDEWGQVHADLARPVLAPPNVSALAVLTPGNSTIETSLYRPTFHKKKMRITFVVSNNGNASQDFRLVFQTARIRQVVCESNSDDGKRNILIAGADVALSMWSHPARRPTLPLTIPIGKKKIFSCELESEVVFSPNPRILDAEAFHDTEQRQAIVDGALFGGLMALAWACLMLGVFGRHRVFLVLALTVTIIAGFEIALRGYGQFYIWPDMSAWNYRSPTILAPLAASAWWYSEACWGGTARRLHDSARCWQAWAPCMDLPLSWQLSAPRGSQQAGVVAGRRVFPDHGGYRLDGKKGANRDQNG